MASCKLLHLLQRAFRRMADFFKTSLKPWASFAREKKKARFYAGLNRSVIKNPRAYRSLTISLMMPPIP